MTDTLSIEKQVAELNFGVTGDRARSFDFSGDTWGETWDYLRADFYCPDCDLHWNEHDGPEISTCPNCGAKDCGEQEDGGPMMNSVWPLPEHYEPTTDDLNKLSCMVVVMIRDSWGDWTHGLALTGGGMDMSWHIARSYIGLGMLPPAVLDAPEFAGMDFNAPENRIVIEALKRSKEGEIQYHQRGIERLGRLTNKL